MSVTSVSLPWERSRFRPRNRLFSACETDVDIVSLAYQQQRDERSTGSPGPGPKLNVMTKMMMMMVVMTVMAPQCNSMLQCEVGSDSRLG